MRSGHDIFISPLIDINKKRNGNRPHVLQVYLYMDKLHTSTTAFNNQLLRAFDSRGAAIMQNGNQKRRMSRKTNLMVEAVAIEVRPNYRMSVGAQGVTAYAPQGIKV